MEAVRLYAMAGVTKVLHEKQKWARKEYILMNHEFTRLMNFKAGVRESKLGRRPLSIWSGDGELVKLIDLPLVNILKDEVSKPDRTFVVITDSQLTDQLVTGRRYAMLAVGPTLRDEWKVGEWL